MSQVLPQDFFAKPAPELARDLIGCVLVHKTPEGTVSGIIVETEAYSQEDAASHSYRGETPRNSVMFGPAGHAYVYFTYGMHYCFNVVSGHKGHGQAVLLRALQPLDGIDLMRQRRKQSPDKHLCNGPAKLVQAMGISKQDYGKPLFEGDLYISGRSKDDVHVQISQGPRIGISKAIDVPWRFWLTDSTFISK